VVGHSYAVTYYYGAAQQTGYTGDTTEAWLVSLGSSPAQESTILSNPSQSANYNGWQQASATFTATATTETLSFLAVGTPSGQPPFSLLDGVTFSDVPEPAAWAMMIVGLGGLGAVARRRRAASALAA
jgi:hypothetical protein